MLRRDGTYKIYIIQGYFKNNGWLYCGIPNLFYMPKEIRWVSIREGIEAEPFQSFTASGKCWQKTGIHGTFSKRKGKKLLSLLHKYIPDAKYRLARLNIKQTTTPIK